MLLLYKLLFIRLYYNFVLPFLSVILFYSIITFSCICINVVNSIVEHESCILICWHVLKNIMLLMIMQIFQKKYVMHKSKEEIKCNLNKYFKIGLLYYPEKKF